MVDKTKRVTHKTHVVIHKTLVVIHKTLAVIHKTHFAIHKTHVVIHKTDFVIHKTDFVILIFVVIQKTQPFCSLLGNGRFGPDTCWHNAFKETSQGQTPEEREKTRKRFPRMGHRKSKFLMRNSRNRKTRTA